MADYPDVYADGLTVTINPAGVALTFTRTDPAVPGISEGVTLVASARVRMSRPVAEAVRDLLNRALSESDQTTQTITH
jgi:hypothetical protein